MATEFKLLRAEIARIERELADAKRKLASLEQSENGGTNAGVRPFAKLRGIWKGADFTEEEIDAVKYKLDDDDHFE
jgi:hypothetical protein